MKRLLVTVTVSLALALPAVASAGGSYIFHHWNGKRIGDFKEAHPRALGFCISSRCDGYWLMKDVDWHNWGHRRTSAHGKLASASLSGTPTRIKARHKQTLHNCFKHGDTVRFYTRARVHIKGEGGHWRSIPHSTLVPKCHR
jgi:hypothetical protein